MKEAYLPRNWVRLSSTGFIHSAQLLAKWLYSFLAALIKGDAKCWYGSTQVLPKKASLASETHDAPYMYWRTSRQTGWVMEVLGVLLGFLSCIETSFEK